MADRAPLAPEDPTSARRAGRLIREAFAGDVSTAVHLAGRERLVRAVEAEHRRRRTPRRSGAVVALAAAAAVLATLGLRLRAARVAPATGTRAPDAPLAFAVTAGARVGERDVRAGEAPAAIRFSDGSDFAVDAHARVSVARVDARGATVALAHGRLVARVVHRPGARWTVSAGPIEVAVTGTRFAVAWDPARALGEVELFEGAVTVRTAGAAREVHLRPGQRLRLAGAFAAGGERVAVDSLAGVDAGAQPASASEPRIGDEASPDERLPPPAPRESPAPGAPSREPSSPSSPSSRAARSARLAAAAPSPAAAVETTDWTVMLARGEFRRVISAADAEGRARALARRGPEDLGALADAARYLRELGLARAALVALRQRFAGTGRAHTAAFTLGRLAEDAGDLAGAARWFELYCSEAPRGALADDARGRLMVVERQRGHAARARALAQEYLARQPGGPFAAAARRLAGP